MSDLPTIVIGPAKVWYHGTDALPLGPGLEVCSFFGGKAVTADRFISQPGRQAMLPSRWIIPARVRRPTLFLDVTYGGKKGISSSIVGAKWYREMLQPYLQPPPGCEEGSYCDYQYAEAFCLAQQDLFPGVAGVYRGDMWGLIVVDPDEIMVYGQPRRAKQTPYAERAMRAWGRH